MTVFFTNTGIPLLGLLAVCGLALLAEAARVEDAQGLSEAQQGNPVSAVFDLISTGLWMYTVAAPAHRAKFCWTRHTMRGIGRPKSQCEEDHELSGALCYRKCGPEWTGVGPACWQGVHAEARGWGQIPTCAPEEEEDAGLCYDKCGTGFHGLGPLCLGECPAALPFFCSAGCTASYADCHDTVIQQISDVLLVGSFSSIAKSIAETIQRKTGTEWKIKIGDKPVGEAITDSIAGAMEKIQKYFEEEGKESESDKTAAAEELRKSHEAKVLLRAVAEGLFEAAKEEYKKGKTVDEVYRLWRSADDSPMEMDRNSLYDLARRAWEAHKFEQGFDHFQWRDIDILGITNAVRSFWRLNCDEI